MVRHSHIQKQVLRLYKEFLRFAKTKPGLSDYIRTEFKKNSTIPRLNTLQIEQLYRRGQRQLKMFKHNDVENVGVFIQEKK